MKTLYVILAIFVLGSAVMAQSTSPSVSTTILRTQDTRNLLWYSASGAVGGSPDTDTLAASGVIKYLVGINFNTAVASDTVYLYIGSNPTGAKYFGKFFIPSTAAPAQFYQQINAKVDSNYVILKRYKTSDVSIIYRTLY